MGRKGYDILGKRKYVTQFFLIASLKCGTWLFDIKLGIPQVGTQHQIAL